MIKVLDFEIDEILADDSFDKIGEEILGKYRICINQKKYKITELEFYLNDASNSLDCFTHNFKFKEYKSGDLRLHGSGIDIVIRDQNFYGGILLRGIREISENEQTKNFDGPWRVSEELLKSISICGENKINIIKDDNNLKVDYYKSSRVGLSLKNCKTDEWERQLRYLYKPWRFLEKPICTKNEKYSILFNLIDEIPDDQMIKKIISADDSIIKNYRNWIDAGRALTADEVLALAPFDGVEKKAKRFGYFRKLRR